MIGSIKNFINSKLTPSEKDFENRGVLTPEQFIQAGDQLQNFGWKWQTSINKLNKHLPDPTKQYLMTQATSLYRI
jgi:ubiquitin-like-conjugating enzyme ATG3